MLGVLKSEMLKGIKWHFEVLNAIFFSILDVNALSCKKWDHTIASLLFFNV